MIRERVKKIMSLCASDVGLKFVRADQDGLRQEPPFMQYKIISEGREESWCAIESAQEDNDRIKITSTRTFSPVVSISVIGIDYASAWDSADSIKNFFESAEGKESCASLGCFPRGMTDIQDRNYFLETENEPRFGFDITLEAKVESVRFEDAIDIESIINF